MDKTFEKWFFESKEVFSKWVSSGDYRKFKPFTQVYGVCFTRDGRILVIKSLKSNWNLPGGTPKKDESPEETLKREVLEEADVIIGKCKMIGACEVKFPGNPNRNEGEHYYQLRYVAIIEEIKERKLDPNRIIFKRN